LSFTSVPFVFLGLNDGQEKLHAEVATTIPMLSGQLVPQFLSLEYERPLRASKKLALPHRLLRLFATRKQ
jgi:hypothetical protein